MWGTPWKGKFDCVCINILMSDDMSSNFKRHSFGYTDLEMPFLANIIGIKIQEN